MTKIWIFLLHHFAIYTIIEKQKNKQSSPIAPDFPIITIHHCTTLANPMMNDFSQNPMTIDQLLNARNISKGCTFSERSAIFVNLLFLMVFETLHYN